MTREEKNACSHRGKALYQMKHYIHKQYGSRHLVVPLAVIVKNGQIIITKRNDPYRPKFHKKWEFPGGSMEFGETIEQNLIREVKEETGLKIKPLQQLRPIYIKSQKYVNGNYQVFLVPYLCTVISQSEKINDAEVLDLKWIKLDEFNKYTFVGENKNLFRKILPELKILMNKYKLN